jgi:hypothetical protein
LKLHGRQKSPDRIDVPGIPQTNPLDGAEFHGGMSPVSTLLAAIRTKLTQSSPKPLPCLPKTPSCQATPSTTTAQ